MFLLHKVMKCWFTLSLSRSLTLSLTLSLSLPPHLYKMQSGVPSPYNSALTGSPSQQQAMQGGPASSMPSSIAVPGSSAAQPPLPPTSGVSGSDQQQGTAAGGAPGASGPTGQIGNPPTPRPAQSSIRDMVSLTLTFDTPFAFF